MAKEITEKEILEHIEFHKAVTKYKEKKQQEEAEKYFRENE